MYQIRYDIHFIQEHVKEKHQEIDMETGMVISEIIWKKLKICKCVKKLLILNAFDNINSLECLNNDSLNDIEEQVNANSDWLNELPECHKQYKNQTIFKLLPAHRAVILNIPRIVSTFNIQDKIQQFDQFSHPAFSDIMNELIESSLKNYGKNPTNNRYSKILMDMSIYIYIIGGKMMYETLSANLPIPSSATVRKFFFKCLYILYSVLLMIIFHFFVWCFEFYSKTHIR